MSVITSLDLENTSRVPPSIDELSLDGNQPQLVKNEDVCSYFWNSTSTAKKLLLLALIIIIIVILYILKQLPYKPK